MLRTDDVSRQEALAIVDKERDRQDAKWGADRTLPWGDWSLILGEEVGEVNKAMLESRWNDNQTLALAEIIDEASQVAAVAVALIEDARRRLAGIPGVKDRAR